MIFKIVHLHLKNYNVITNGQVLVTIWCVACEEFAVRRGFLKKVPVDTETRRISDWYVI